MKVRARWEERDRVPEGRGEHSSDPRLAGSPGKGHSCLTEDEWEDTGWWENTVTSGDCEATPGGGTKWEVRSGSGEEARPL